MLEELNLRAWPFQTVPDPEFARTWAGRRRTKLQIDQLLSKMQMAPRSGLRFVWANFGMGKTHTLMHLRYLCSKTAFALIPVYVVLPSKPVGFLDTYRAIATELPFEYLGEQLLRVGAGSPGGVAQHPMFTRTPGVVNALLAIRSGDSERVMAARQWLTAQPGLGARDLRTLNVTYRIKTAEDAIQALTTLTQLAAYKPGKPAKLVILLDEYQRLGALKPAVRNDINAAMHAFFNANPTGLEIILTFSFGHRNNIKFMLNEELLSRAELQTLNLDVLTPDEAFEFLQDLLSQFRIRPAPNATFPFSDAGLREIIHHIAASTALTPRRLMLYCNHVLQEWQLAGCPGDEIEVTDVQAYLAQIDADNLDSDQSEPT